MILCGSAAVRLKNKFRLRLTPQPPMALSVFLCTGHITQVSSRLTLLYKWSAKVAIGAFTMLRPMVQPGMEFKMILLQYRLHTIICQLAIGCTFRGFLHFIKLPRE